MLSLSIINEQMAHSHVTKSYLNLDRPPTDRSQNRASCKQIQMRQTVSLKKNSQLSIILESGGPCCRLMSAT